MDTSFDQHGINHATVAVSLEMQPAGTEGNGDVLFLGGRRPTERDRASLVDFALRKNYNLIVASFDASGPGAGRIGFDAVITDGETQSVCLTGGRLWKRDRRTPAVLLFSDERAMIKVSRKGRMVVAGMTGRHHDQGFDFASEAVVARTARKPGTVPVVTQVGGLTIVLDTHSLAAMLEAA